LQRELVKEMLERDGHKVETADSGESGVEIFPHAISRREPFEIVITDLGMPYVDGREVAKIIKQGSPATPVVLLTGWGEFISDDETALSDFDELLNKPPRLSEFREMFRRVNPPNRQRQKIFRNTRRVNFWQIPACSIFYKAGCDSPSPIRWERAGVRVEFQLFSFKFSGQAVRSEN